ncbi:MAG: peptidoglycan-binding protein, partial [Clostridia bacterium]|nr:peptidoglycan-binding protein [Clostridia bacterium]
MAYSIIKYGSTGDDVRKLQEKLNEYGYGLDTDGIFGVKTQSAVRDYQKNNGLSVDGIVGANTWGKLNASSQNTNNNVQQNQNNLNTNSSSNFSESIELPERPEYVKSQAVIDAENKVKEWENGAPSAYESKYSQQIESILNDILNRERFEYNLNADPLYHQYRELYTENGKKAMMDTVADASALTGGYGNTYAISAGSEAYHEYLNNLNSVALDLRDRAYETYKDEGEKLFDDIAVLRSLDGDDYKKYLDELNRYYKDGDYLIESLANMTDAEFGAFLATVDAWENDRDFSFKEYMDSLDRQEFQKELEFKKAEAERKQANEDRDYALQLQKLYSSSSSSSKKD